MTNFFDKLRLDRQFIESLRLSDSISDPKVQSLLKAQLALYFSGMPKETDFLSLLKLLQGNSTIVATVAGADSTGNQQTGTVG